MSVKLLCFLHHFHAVHAVFATGAIIHNLGVVVHLFIYGTMTLATFTNADRDWHEEEEEELENENDERYLDPGIDVLSGLECLIIRIFHLVNVHPSPVVGTLVDDEESI